MKNKGLNKKNRVIIVLASITVVLIISFLVLLCIAKFDTNIKYNIYVNGKNYKNYSISSITNELVDVSEKIKNTEINILQSGKVIYKVKPDMIMLQLDVNKILDNILNVEKNKSIFENMLAKFGIVNEETNIEFSLSYDEEKLNTLIKNIDLTLDNRTIYDTYSLDLDDNKIVFIKGKDGEKIDFENTKKDILSAFKDGKTSINLKVINEKSNVLNSEEISKKLTREPEDAYLDQSIKPVKFVKEVEGIRVDKSVIQEEINVLASLNEGETLKTDIEVIKPSVYLKDIYYDTYNDKIASFTTYFAGSQSNRANNINVASSYINDKIIMPGETFSFNDAVGEVTTSKGYLMAATFSGGKVVEGLGGGICQVSSTLYNAALMANLDVVERYAHSLYVSYVLPSRDATIFVGTLDLKIKNTRNHAVKIITSYSPTGSLTISIYGTKEEKEYEIDIESHVIEELKPQTEYIEDSLVEKGKQEVIQTGVSGCISEAYIVKKLDGKQVERKLLSHDVYSPVNKIVKVNNN